MNLQNSFGDTIGGSWVLSSDKVSINYNIFTPVLVVLFINSTSVLEFGFCKERNKFGSFNFIFFSVRESSDFSSFQQEISIGKFDVEKSNDTMANSRNYSSFLPDSSGDLLELFVVWVVENDTMTS